MEEVVSNKDDDEEEINSSTYPHTNTYLFPHLHLLKFEWLKNLKCIGGGGGAKDTTSVVHDQFEFPGMGHVIPWSLCQYSREMYIKGCHGLSSVVPYYATPHMQKLQVLEVYSCESLREVFEAQENDDHNGNRSGSSSTDTTTTTTAIPRRENIIVPQLSNLKKLVITHCDLLQHVLTFSTLESLKKLEELMIQECEEMNVIVKQEENGTTTPNVVVFPRLKTLKLLRLPNLKGFFLGSNDFEWPLLEKVTIMECPQIVSFTDGHSTAPKLEYIQTSLGKYNLDLNFRGTRDFDEIRSEGTSSEPLRWSFRDLIEIDMNDDWEVKGIIPSDKLLQLQKLERIRAYNCCCVKEVFEVAGVVKHKHITPSDRFDESHSVVEISNLKQVELYSLASLEYIWESNHQHKTILLSFPNLTTLSIDKCNSLKHVFTSSMVDSLAQLQHLHITHCKNMEVVVKEETRVKYDAKVKEIVLPYLKSLKLEKLKSIKGFCLGDDDFNWPLLHTLKINECPEIMVFSKGHVATPTLDIIDTCFGRCYLEGDINSFLKTKQHEGFQF